MPVKPDKLAQEVIAADCEVEELRERYNKATERRRQVFQRAAKTNSRQAIADTIGKSVARVQQIVRRQG